MSSTAGGSTGSALPLDVWQVSDRGRCRDLNEDCAIVHPQAGVFAVADGMGGHEGGELASAALSRHLLALAAPGSALELRAGVEDGVGRANAEIREISAARGGVTIGSTLAALIVYGEQYGVFWAGDSRVYHWRDGALTQLSRDHTEVQDLIEQGLIRPEEAAAYPRRNVITNAIGISDTVVLDVAQGTLLPGDRFILCSDGLTTHLEDPEIADLAGRHEPREAVERMLAMVLERGASDNVTIVLVRCAGTAP